MKIGPDTVPQSTVALRLAGDNGWRIESIACEEHALPAAIARLGRPVVDWRHIESGYVLGELLGYRRAEQAHMRGWAWDVVSRCWRAPDEPLPAPGGSPTQGTLEARVRRIGHGSAELALSAVGKEVVACCNDVYDPFVELVRLTRTVKDGGLPRVAIDNGSGQWATISAFASDSALVRLRVRQSPGDDDQIIDVLIDRGELCIGLQSLLDDVASHPNFAVGWACHASLDDAKYDPLSDDADRAWTDSCRDRAGTNQSQEAYFDFAAAFISAGYVLTEKELAHAENYRTMLRTLQVPAAWR